MVEYADHEADASIIQKAYEKVLNPTKSELTNVCEELKSDDSNADDNNFWR